MFSQNDKISIRQLQTLLILDVFGTGVIILPRIAAQYAAQDGWIVIIFVTLLACLQVFLITTLAKMFPNDSFLTYCSKIVSRPLAFLISAGFIVKIIITIALELRFFGEIIKQTLLYHTPLYVVFIAMVMVCGYVAAKGIEARARTGELLLPVLLIPIVFVFVLASFNVSFSNLQPVFSATPGEIAEAVYYCGYSYSGIEFLLLVFPYLNNPKRARKASLHAVLFIGLLMILITVVTIAQFGPVDVIRQQWPVLSMMSLIDFPGAFIERQDALIMSFWIISVFAIVNAGMFFAAAQLKDIVQKGRLSVYILCLIPPVALVSFYPNNMAQVFDLMQKTFFTFGLAYMMLIPLVLLVIAKIRGL